MTVDHPNILLVEDEPSQREVLTYNLEAEGFKIICADNGEDALLLVEEEEPDLILLDWMMPNLSGIEVCRRLKSRVETRSIPIIMLSARSEEMDVFCCGTDCSGARPIASDTGCIYRCDPLFSRYQA